MDPQEISKLETDLSEMMRKRMGIHGETLSKQVHRAGRRLPRRLRGPAARFAESAALAGHPTLSRQLSQDRLTSDARALQKHLSTQSRRERWASFWRNTMGVIVFNLLVVAIGLITILSWRGFI